MSINRDTCIWAFLRGNRRPNSQTHKFGCRKCLWSHLDARSFISGGRDRRWRRLAFVLTVRPALCPIIITADVFSSLRLFLPLAPDQAFSSSFFFLLIGSSLFDNRVAESTSFCPRFWFLKLILKRIRWKKT